MERTIITISQGLLSVFAVDGQNDKPITAHPMIWFPAGSPCLACKDMALDLVTRIASMISPTYKTSAHLKAPRDAGQTSEKAHLNASKQSTEIQSLLDL